MKQLLLAGSALAVLAATQQAQAASDLYISVFGGANFHNDQSQRTSFYSTSFFKTDADTGFALGAAVGTRLDNWAKGLRVEAEVAYRRNDVGGRWTSSTGSYAGPLDGNVSSFSIMANAWYDIDIGTKFRPYVGGGIGWARTHSEFVQIVTYSDGPVSPFVTSSTSNDTTGLAWQLGLGINYEVAPDVNLGIGYRYFVGPRVKEVVDFFNNENIDNENHAVQVNLTIGIN